MKRTSESIVVLIGAGSLGRRHLEGLLSVRRPLLIYVIDPSLEALRDAKKLTARTRHKVFCATRIPALSRVDLAIVATTSQHRANMVRELLQKSEIVRYIVLEKILFDKKSDYAAIQKLLRKRRVRAWVNCPLRLFPLQHQLPHLLGIGPISCHVSAGARYGLMTNIVHYADLMCFLTGSNRFTTDTSLLSPRVVPSKRQGFKELQGSLTLRFPGGSRLIATTLPQGGARSTTVLGSRARVILIETTQTADIAEKRTGWKWKEVPAPFLLQSKMTGDIASQILIRGMCELPTLEESSRTHLQILESVQKFLRKNGYRKTAYPFT